MNPISNRLEFQFRNLTSRVKEFRRLKYLITQQRHNSAGSNKTFVPWSVILVKWATANLFNWVNLAQLQFQFIAYLLVYMAFTLLKFTIDMVQTTSTCCSVICMFQCCTHIQNFIKILSLWYVRYSFCFSEINLNKQQNH